MKTFHATHFLSNPLLATAALLASAFLVSCAAPKSHQTKTNTPAAAPQITEAALVGEWEIAIEPTADILARAQFGTKQTFTVKRGEKSPTTNIVNKPFDQKKFDESKAFWVGSLQKPEMKWRLSLRPDGSGSHIATGKSGDPHIETFSWETMGAGLRIVYPDRQHHNTYDGHIVSSNEWHYPMRPLGGCFVLQRR